MVESAPATVVLVHGAFHGAWCWDRVVPRLEAAGVPAIAVGQHDDAATRHAARTAGAA